MGDGRMRSAECGIKKGAALTVPEKFFNRQPDVARNLPQQRWGNVATFMHGNGRSASVGVTILNVRTALANGIKTQAFKQPAYFDRLEDGH
jgi:hypothetical protein